MDALARLKWQCRRGTKELDSLLLGYLEAEYWQTDEEEKSRFVLLLTWEDDELQGVLLGGKDPVEIGFESLVDKIRRIS